MEGLRKIGIEICKKHQVIQSIKKICKSGKAGYRVSCISWKRPAGNIIDHREKACHVSTVKWYFRQDAFRKCKICDILLYRFYIFSEYPVFLDVFYKSSCRFFINLPTNSFFKQVYAACVCVFYFQNFFYSHSSDI